MSLNAALALEILKIASSHTRGVSFPSEAVEYEHHFELRRTLEALVAGEFLVSGNEGQYVVSRRGLALIKSLEKQVEKDEARKKKITTLLLDIFGS